MQMENKKRASTMTANFEVITPETAAAMLLRNVTNRKLSHFLVERYAADLKRGDWTPSCQGIGFGLDGTLYDGQHRLSAIVRTGRAAEMLVVRGLPAVARNNIDAGARRTVAQNWAMNTGEGKSTRLIGIANALHQLATNETRGTYATAQETMDHYGDAIREIEAIGNIGPIRLGMVSAALAFALATDREKIQSFAKEIGWGVNLVVGSPALSLRNYLASPLGKSIAGSFGPDRREIGLRVLRGAQGYLSGEHMPKVPAANPSALAFFGIAHGLSL